MKPNSVPTIFINGPLLTKKLKRHEKNISQDAGDMQCTIKTCAEATSSLFIYYRFIGLIENEKLLGYNKEKIKACDNQFKVKKTRQED